MKPLLKLLPAMMLFAGCLSGYAQGNETAARRQHLGHISAMQTRNGARITAAATSRLIATSLWSYDGTNYVFGDTSVLTYTGTRGQGPTAGTWLYDNWTHTWYSGISSRQLQTFDANNNVIEKIEQNWDTTTHVWKNAYKYANTYDAANNPIITIGSQWNTVTGAWDSTTKNLSTYDAANNLLQSLSLGWNGTAWEDQTQTNYTYDASNNRLGYIAKHWVAPSWQDQTKATYTYNTANDVVLHLEETMGSGGWENALRDSFSYSSIHVLQTAIMQDWNGAAFVNRYRWLYTWNADTLPEYFSTSNWNATAGVWDTTPGDYIYHYYYGTYATGIDNKKAAAADIMVAPVPANNTISVSVTWAEPQPFSISLTNIAGRMYSRQDIYATKNYRDDISVADLPEGMYLLVVEGKDSKEIRKIAVVH